MRYRFGEPVATCFYKLAFVQACTLFAPSVALRDLFECIDQVALHPFGSPIPLNVMQTVLEVDRPGQSVQTDSAPIPHFECEDIWSRADLQNHTVLSRTVRCSSR